jgi:NADH dehydrogenase [ubiquinone] 1 alpha subcomplex assembly factor 2
LLGNTFWEFRDALNANRLRRIVKYNNKTHLGDVKISRMNALYFQVEGHPAAYNEIAQWHQWLRYVRQEPPSLEEQRRDVIRQVQIKKLAQIADAKWAAKPSLLDRPQTQSPNPVTRTSDQTAHTADFSDTELRRQSRNEKGKQSTKAENLSANVPTGPGENWQPQPWSPGTVRR